MADRLASIRKQIVALEKRASELMRAENKKVIDRIKALIAKHQLTAEDLGLGGSSGRAASSADAPARKTRGGQRSAAAKKGGIKVGVPMYRDPKSGKTWTGRGKPPNWIVKAKDRTPFLIGNAGTAGEEAPSKAAAKAATKAAAKGRKARAAKPAAEKAVVRKASAKRAAKVPAAPKPPKPPRAPRKAAGKAASKAASKRTAKGPGRTAPPPPAPAAAVSTEA